MANLILTIAIAAVLGYVCMKLQIPGGMLIGAIVGVAALNIATPLASMPLKFKVIAQTVIGSYLGSTVTRSDVTNLPKVIKPFLVIISGFLVLDLVMGFLIWRITDLDLLTSLFCAMPGGVSDTPLVAMDMGANVPIVSVLQFARLLFGLGALPSIIVAVDRAITRRSNKAVETEEKPVQVVESVPRKRNPVTFRNLMITLGVGALSGAFGKISGIPAGTLIFSMIGVAVLNTTWQRACMPFWIRRCAQVLSGCCIGIQITYYDLLEMWKLFIPILLVLAGYFVNCVLIGMILSKRYAMGRQEAMLCVAPAGASEMALTAADMGIDSPYLAVIQISRLLVVMALFPQVFNLIIWVTGAG